MARGREAVLLVRPARGHAAERDGSCQTSPTLLTVRSGGFAEADFRKIVLL